MQLEKALGHIKRLERNIRDRQDPESRDFSCSCGKSYLSYAAAYTHVKNKHNSEKAFLDAINKPTREKLRRGRPKERKQLNNNSEAEELSIVEEAILKIFNEVSSIFSRVILEGNEDLNNEEINTQF
ncbi:unnamed protein product [Sphagnum balticum]